MRKTLDIVRNAWKAGTVVPGFNIPYLPMMEPVVRALRDTRCFGLVMVARLEWEKFEARSLRAVRDEYEHVKDERFTRLHLDHVPVLDEDGKRVDFEAVFTEALGLGYQSVMVDGSRLPLEENIVATRRAAEMAHGAGVPVEAELGAVFGHEPGPPSSYEEMFVSGRGFTDPEEAARFVETTGADWLSVAVGNVHGAISPSRKDEKKVRARLHIEHLERIRRATRVPLVLHGGTGIPKECVREAVKHGIAKINVGAGIRQPYEALAGDSVEKAREAVYEAVVRIVRGELEIENSAAVVNP